MGTGASPKSMASELRRGGESFFVENHGEDLGKTEEKCSTVGGLENSDINSG